MNLDNAKCPLCKNEGKKAKSSSIIRIVKEDLKYLVEKENYYFCNGSDCEVIFFSDDYEKTFLLQDVNLTVEENVKPHCGRPGEKKSCGECQGCGNH